MVDPLKERLEELRREAEDYLSAHPQEPPRPYHFDDSRYSDEECLQIAGEYYSRWLLVLSRDSQRLAELGIHADSDEAWRKVSFAMACLFAPLILRAERLLFNPEIGASTRWLPPIIGGIRGYASLCTADYGFDAAVERRMLSEFLGGIWHAYFMTIVGSPVLGRTPQGWDEFIYTAFDNINDVSLASGKREHLLLGGVLSRALAIRCRQAVHQRDDADFEIRNRSLGSFVILDELSLLACRSDIVIERYGESEIEIRFEAQLALLMQSLGFLVIRTERAQRRIDLVCIAPGSPEESYTVLLEAKTTASNYTLPTKDSRAIAEYVVSVRSALKTLPPLRLVIVVGSTPAKTVAAKLGALEAQCGLPIRYCDVALLRHLRHQVPGPVNHMHFLKVCINADRILGSQEIHQIVEADKAIRAAHDNFVQALLAQSSENVH